jgi:hypothetical protein
MRRKTVRIVADSVEVSTSKAWMPEVPEILVTRIDRKSMVTRPPTASTVPTKTGFETMSLWMVRDIPSVKEVLFL